MNSRYNSFMLFCRADCGACDFTYSACFTLIFGFTYEWMLPQNSLVGDRKSNNSSHADAHSSDYIQSISTFFDSCRQCRHYERLELFVFALWHFNRQNMKIKLLLFMRLCPNVIRFSFKFFFFWFSFVFVLFFQFFVFVSRNVASSLKNWELIKIHR